MNEWGEKFQNQIQGKKKVIPLYVSFLLGVNNLFRLNDAVRLPVKINPSPPTHKFLLFETPIKLGNLFERFSLRIYAETALHFWGPNSLFKLRINFRRGSSSWWFCEGFFFTNLVTQTFGSLSRKDLILSLLLRISFLFTETELYSCYSCTTTVVVHMIFRGDQLRDTKMHVEKGRCLDA